MAGMVWIRMRKRNSRFNLRRTAPRNAVSSAAENSKDIYRHLNTSADIDQPNDTYTSQLKDECERTTTTIKGDPDTAQLESISRLQLQIDTKGG